MELSCFDKETSNNYELGWRGVFKPAKLDFALALFHSGYRDLQTEVSVGVLASYLSNAEKARSRGFELSGGWWPLDQLRKSA